MLRKYTMVCGFDIHHVGEAVDFIRRERVLIRSRQVDIADVHLL